MSTNGQSQGSTRVIWRNYAAHLANARPREISRRVPLLTLCTICSLFSLNYAVAQPTKSQPAKNSDKSIKVAASQIAHVNEYIDRIEAFGFSGVVLVMQGEKVHVLRGCGESNRESGSKNTSATLFDIGSLTKQFTAAAVVKLQSAGRLRFDDSIAEYLPDVPSDKQHITIHQLLTHTSGLPAGVAIKDAAETDRRLAIEAILALELSAKPGTRYAYSNAGYSLLACVIEEISGETFESFLKKKLFIPAGMLKTGFIGDRDIDKKNVATGYNLKFPDGIVGLANEQWYHWGLRGAGGVLLPMTDLIKWEMTLQGPEVLSDQEKQLLFTNHAQTFGTDSHYGYGWQLTDGLQDPQGCLDLDMPLISHGGDTRGFEAKYFRIPDAKIAIMVMANNNDHYCWIMPPRILGILTNGDCKLPPPVAKLKPSDLKRWQGIYKSADGIRVSIRVDGDYLQLMPLGQAAFNLIVLNGLVGSGFESIYKETNDLVESFINAWQAKDIDKLSTILVRDHSEASQQLIARLDKEANTLGGYESHNLIGTILYANNTRTIVEMVLAKRRTKLLIGTDQSRVNAVKFPVEYPVAVRFVPESSSQVNSYYIMSSAVKSLACIDKKSTDRLRLTGFGGVIVDLVREGEELTHGGPKQKEK